MSGTTDAAALAGRAKTLREAHNRELAEARLKHHADIDHLTQKAGEAHARATHATKEAATLEKQTAAEEARLVKEAKRADELDRKGLSSDAATIREEIETQRVTMQQVRERIEKARSEADAAQAEGDAGIAQAKALVKKGYPEQAALESALQEIDDLEDKATYLREAQVHDMNVARLQDEVAALRATGNDEEADRRTQELVDERIAASAKRDSADEINVDESKFKILDEPSTTPGPNAVGAPEPEHLAAGTGSMDPVFGDLEASPIGAPSFEGSDVDTAATIAAEFDTNLDPAGTDIDGFDADAAGATAVSVLDRELTPGLDAEPDLGQAPGTNDFVDHTLADDRGGDIGSDDLDLDDGSFA